MGVRSQPRVASSLPIERGLAPLRRALPSAPVVLRPPSSNCTILEALTNRPEAYAASPPARAPAAMSTPPIAHVRRNLSRTRLSLPGVELSLFPALVKNPLSLRQRPRVSFLGSAIAPPRNLPSWRGMLLGQM